MVARRILLVLAVLGAAAWFAYDTWRTAREMDDARERFVAVDRRIESMLPKPTGEAPTPTHPSDEGTIRLVLARPHAEDPARAHTTIRLEGEDGTYALPRGWRGRGEETAARVEAYDATIADVTRAVRARVASLDTDPATARGEVVASPPSAGAVPHGDVVNALNVFLSLGVIDVVFEGAATPRTAKERAARAAGGDGR